MEKQEARRKMATNPDGIEEEIVSFLVKNSRIDRTPKYVPEHLFMKMPEAFNTKSMFKNRVDIVANVHKTDDITANFFKIRREWEKIAIPDGGMVYWFVNYIANEMEGINLNHSWTVLVEGRLGNFTLRFLFEDANDMKKLLDILSTLSL